MIYSKKDMDKILNEYNKYSYKCSCGHTVVIFPKEEKKLCKWCNNYVFKNKLDEFKYRFNEVKNK